MSARMLFVPLVLIVMLVACAPMNSNLRPDDNLTMIFRDTEPLKTIPVPLEYPDFRAVHLDRNANVTLEKFSFWGSMTDFVSVLKEFGLSTIIADDCKRQKVEIRHFSGNLRELAEILSRQGIFTSEVGSIISIECSKRMTVLLPSFPDEYMKIFLSDLQKMGVRASYSPLTQRLAWEGDAKTLEIVKKVYDKIVQNYAKIEYQVVVFEAAADDLMEFGLNLDATATLHTKKTVTESLQEQDGISWTTTQLERGSSKTLDFSIHSVQDLLQKSSVLALDTPRFNGIFSFMLQNGKARIVQKVLLSTTNLGEVQFDVGEKIPYVKEITQAYLQNQTQPNTTPQVSVSFDEILSGIHLTLKPRLIAEYQAVDTDVEITVNNIVSMVELRAGDQVYTRPRSAEKKIKSNLILPLGSVYIFGGFEFEKAESLSEKTLLHWKKTKRGSRLFFAIRPNAVFFTNKGENHV